MKRWAWLILLAGCATRPAQPPAEPVEAPAREEPKAGRTVEVPFDEEVAVEVRINGTGPYRFQVDTGTNETILSNKLDKPDGIRRLEIGGAVVTDLPFKMMDISRVTEAQGLIGIDVLQRFIPTLDFAARKLILRPRGKPHGEQGDTAPFELLGPNRIVAAGMLQKRSIRWWIHTGYVKASVVASLTAYEEAGVGVSTAREAADRGEVKVTMVLVQGASIGTYKRPLIPGLAGAFPRGLDQVEGKEIEGLLTAAFFGGAALTLDFDRNELVIRR